MNNYSQYKIVHHPKELEALKSGRVRRPLHVQLIITNRCNQSCLFCAYRMKNYPCSEMFNSRDELPFKGVQRILLLLRKSFVKAIQFTGGGEPLLHSRAYDIISYALELGFEVSLVTNGTFINKKMAKLISHLSWARISIDAGNSAQYGILRKTTFKIDKIWAATKSIKDFNGQCVLGHSFVVNKLNMFGIYEAAKMAKESGVDNIRFSAAFTPEGSLHFAKKDILYIDNLIALSKRDFEDNSFSVQNSFGARIGDLSGEIDFDFCAQSKVSTYIGADGIVYPCCCKAYTKNGAMFSVLENDFESGWHSWHEKNFFFDPRVECKNYCMFSNQNRFVKYLLDSHPIHVNFV